LQDPPRSVDAETERGLRLAVRVMTVAGVVEVASLATLSLQTVFGAACCVAGLAWLVRHRGR
jgi:hypothetical protein